MSTGEMVLCGVAIAMMALGVLILWGTLRVRAKNRQSSRWPTAVGTITESELSSRISIDDGRRTTMYGASIRYTYTVAGKTYETDQVQLGGSSESNRPQSYQGIVDRYAVGKQVTVFYDPQDAGNATLEPGATGGVFNMAMVGGGFVLVGGVIAALTIWGKDLPK